MNSLEYLAAGTIIFLQVYFFIKTFLHIRKLKNLFPIKLDSNKDPSYYVIKTDDVELIGIHPQITNKNQLFNKIVSNTNKYLVNNKGTAADFNLIKDITERVSEAEENSISVSVSLPLFIGLMGTFIGVGLGIISLLKGTLVTPDIESFLEGVLIAMIASFLGLILTTINNAGFFKNAKMERDKRKNDYYNYLQVELLPILNRDLTSSLSNLKGTLDGFNKTFSSDLITNLNNFNFAFSKNIARFGENTELVTNNINQQREFLKEVNKLGIKRVVEANLEIFNKIDQKKELFDILYKYAEKLTKSIENSTGIAEKIELLLNRVTDFEENIKILTKNFSTNELVIQQYITDVITRSGELKKRYETILQHISKIDSENEKYISTEINAIHELTSKSIKEVENISGQLQENISQLDNTIKEKLTRSFDFTDERQSITDLLEHIREEFKNRYETILQHINRIDSENEKYISTEINAIHELTSKSIKEVENISGQLQENISQLDNTIKEKLTRSFDFTDERQSITDLLEHIREEFKKIAIDTKNETSETVSAHKVAIDSITKSSINEINSVSSTISHIKNSTSDIREKFDDISKILHKKQEITPFPNLKGIFKKVFRVKNKNENRLK